MLLAKSAYDAAITLVVKLLNDADHLVRVEAVNALARCASKTSHLALEEALDDRSTTVQEAAKQSLGARAQFMQWRDSLADPRD